MAPAEQTKITSPTSEAILRNKERAKDRSEQIRMNGGRSLRERRRKANTLPSVSEGRRKVPGR